MTDRAELYDRLPVVETDRWWRELAAASPDGEVVEFGAGTGRLTSLLVDAGARVTAVERDPAMVERLRARVGDRAEVVVGDVTALPPGPRVGLVAIPAALLNELPDAAARGELLQAAAQRCRPDGVVAIHLLGPWWLASLVGRTRSELVPADGGPSVEVTLDAGTFDAWTARRHARLVYRFPDQGLFADDLDAAVVGPTEIDELVTAAGLRLTGRYGAVPPDEPRAHDAAWHLLARPAGDLSATG